MLKRYQRKVKQADRRAGGIIAAMYNIHTRTSEADRLRDWDDYFTEWKVKSSEQTEEEMIEVMRALMVATNQEGLSH